MRRRKKIYQEESGLDLTPILDIVFIMLIFFIVTTSFVKESGIEVNRPNAETAERNEKGNIIKKETFKRKDKGFLRGMKEYVDKERIK